MASIVAGVLGRSPHSFGPLGPAKEPLGDAERPKGAEGKGACARAGSVSDRSSLLVLFLIKDINKLEYSLREYGFALWPAISYTCCFIPSGNIKYSLRLYQIFPQAIF